MPFSPYVPLSQVDLLAPIRPEQSCAPLAPRVALHRTVEDAVDSAAPTIRSSGINLAGFVYANVEVVPKAGAPQPNIEVLRWSADAGKFISYVSAKTATAPAANTPYAVQFPVNGDIIWVMIGGTMVLNDVVEILVSGSNSENRV